MSDKVKFLYRDEPLFYSVILHPNYKMIHNFLCVYRPCKKWFGLKRFELLFKVEVPKELLQQQILPKTLAEELRDKYHRAGNTKLLCIDCSEEIQKISEL